MKKQVSTTVARMCNNCADWDRNTSRCPIYKKITQSFMFCPSHEFIEERMARQEEEMILVENVEAAATEAILAFALTTATSSSCFLEDFERRTKRFYENEEDGQVKRWLRKDLYIAEEIEGALKKIKEYLREIEKQYRFYIQSNLDKMHTIDKKFNALRSDAHLRNSMDFNRLLIEFTRKCIGNEENYNKVFAFIDSLENDRPYPLTEKDAQRFKLKM